MWDVGREVRFRDRVVEKSRRCRAGVKELLITAMRKGS